MRLFAALAVLLSLGAVANADVVTLNAVADNRLLSFSPTDNDNGEGLATFDSSGNIQRTLIRFDLSSLTGATIASATLRLNGESFSGSTAATSIDLFRVISSWSETTSSWNVSSLGNPWTNPGGDAVGTTSSQLTSPYYHWTGNGSATPIWVEFDATSLVAGAASGTFANNGWLLTAPDNNQFVFISREGFKVPSGIGSSTDVPQLVVNFTPAAAPEPGSLGIAMVGVVAFLRRARR